MARPWRIQYEGAIYHVMSRGVGRGKIFLANDDYFRILKYVASAKEKLGNRVKVPYGRITLWRILYANH